jgi:hypothetical protein
VIVSTYVDSASLTHLIAVSFSARVRQRHRAQMRARLHAMCDEVRTRHKDMRVQALTCRTYCNGAMSTPASCSAVSNFAKSVEIALPAGARSGRGC